MSDVQLRIKALQSVQTDWRWNVTLAVQPRPFSQMPQPMHTVQAQEVKAKMRANSQGHPLQQLRHC